VFNDVVSNIRDTPGFGGWLLKVVGFAGEKAQIALIAKFLPALRTLAGKRIIDSSLVRPRYLRRDRVAMVALNVTTQAMRQFCSINQRRRSGCARRSLLLNEANQDPSKSSGRADL